MAISSGPFFTCALREDGTPVCWGKGYDTPEPERTTYTSIRNEQFIAIASGFEHTCALRSDGTPACVGIKDATDLNTAACGRPEESSSLTWLRAAARPVAHVPMVLSPVGENLLFRQVRRDSSVSARDHAMCAACVPTARLVAGDKLVGPQAPTIGGHLVQT